MRKFYPYSFGIFAFFFFLFVQGILDLTQVNAKEGDQKTEVSSEKIKSLQFKFVQSGENISFKEIKQPLVIINFWASWCLPCIKEFKGLNNLIQKVGKEKILVIGVNNDYEDSRNAVLKTMKKYNLSFDSVFDNNIYTKIFGVENIPQSFVLYKGKIINHLDGEFDFENESFISKLMSYL